MINASEKIEKSLVFTWKHWLDFSWITSLEFSKENTKQLITEFNIYRKKLDNFLDEKVNSSTNHISKEYIKLAWLLSNALKDKEGFEEYKIKLVFIIKEINTFIIENSSKITETTDNSQNQVAQIVHKYWINMAWPQ